MTRKQKELLLWNVLEKMVKRIRLNIDNISEVQKLTSESTEEIMESVARGEAKRIFHYVTKKWK